MGSGVSHSLSSSLSLSRFVGVAIRVVSNRTGERPSDRPASWLASKGGRRQCGMRQIALATATAASTASAARTAATVIVSEAKKTEPETDSFQSETLVQENQNGKL